MAWSVSVQIGETVTPDRLVSGALVVETTGPGFVDLGASITEFLAEIGAGAGLLTLFVRHTSASLTIQENADPDVQFDLSTALDRLAPRGSLWRHGIEGPDDMPAHVKAMLTETSLTVPIDSGRMGLGTWQAVYLIEHRDQPHRRQVSLRYMGT